ncbi:MAG: acetylglutamate kinase [Microscillaceae bacterium]|jgi:acetylglutamate kinase|nr:acetylglutamate kinase [Microscillaceae bacterium]
MQNLTVIKIGGNVIDNETSLTTFLEKFADLPTPKILIHGGGKIATKTAEKLGISTQMVEGRRITDQAMLEVAMMVYAGLINKNIVAQLQARGSRALGLTGADLDLIRADKRPVKAVDYGWVGDVKSINVAQLDYLLKGNITPVFCALSHNGQGQMLNTNADTIASEVAIAMSDLYAVNLVFCFEKRGVLLDVNDESSVINQLNDSDYQMLKSQGAIHSGMIPKLDNAFAAIRAGVKKVIIRAPEIADSQGTTILG